MPKIQHKKLMLVSVTFLIGGAVSFVLQRAKLEKIVSVENLLPSNSVPLVKKISVSDNSKDGENLTLVRQENHSWIIKHGDDQFIADSLVILQVLDRLAKCKKERLISEQVDLLESLGFGKGFKISLFFTDGSEHALVLGSLRKGGGQYVTQGDHKIWLSDLSLQLSIDPQSWELKDLLQLTKKDIMAVEFKLSKELAKAPESELTFELKRESVDKNFLLIGKSEKEVLLEDRANFVDSLFAAIPYRERVLRESLAETKELFAAKVTTFSGEAFLISALLGENEEFFLRVDYTPSEKVAAEDLRKIWHEVSKRWAFKVDEKVLKNIVLNRTYFVKAPQ